MTITSEQIVTLASVVGAVVGLWAIFSKPFMTLKKIDQRTSKMAKQVKLHGDMISELLDHAITNNNTGKMTDIKKKYDETYRNMDEEED